MLRTYQMIWDLLIPRERRKFLLLIAMTVVMAVFEVTSVAGIMPFMAVLAQPDLITTNPVLQMFTRVTGLSDPREVTIAIGVTVIAVVVVGMAIRTLVTYYQLRFGVNRGWSIGTRLLNDYLSRDYDWHFSRNSAALSQTLLSEVDTVVRESILPAVLLISSSMMIVMIGGLLFLADPLVATMALALLGGIYTLIFLILRPRMYSVGKERVQANQDRFRVVQEIAGGLKEIKVMGLESTGIRRFRAPARRMAENQALGLIFGRLPRYVLEAVVYAAFIGLVLIMILVRGDDVARLLPLFTLIGVAVMKLFPALQQMYQDLSLIRFSSAGLEALHKAMTSAPPPPMPQGTGQRLALRHSLEIDRLSYNYPGSDRSSLKQFSVTLPACTTIGIVGGTGAGKTTLVDMILGLLTPDSGEIRIDGKVLSCTNVRDWQRSVGYVPQTIYLADTTLAENIAFGVPVAEIDLHQVERAARIANLHDFISRDLAQGYQTLVGERGLRLSGGQRQRIGIARALYRQPDLLVLDEATSALDTVTERAVMEAVHNLGGETTVIMIAHRLSTVEDCDLILVLDQGKLVGSGSYDELLETSPRFRELANA